MTGATLMRLGLVSSSSDQARLIQWPRLCRQIPIAADKVGASLVGVQLRASLVDAPTPTLLFRRDA